MKEYKMKYGKEKVNLCLNEENLMGVIESNKIDNKKSEEEVILNALENPIDSPKLCDIVNEGEKICIVISDITRAWQKMGAYLHYIVDELNKGGVSDEDIVFLSATGSHRKQSKEEHDILLGEKLADRFEVIDHDCLDKENLVYLGKTSFGTPVEINRIAMGCDHIILTGAIVFHLLAGWGGGKKSILPGISSYDSIMKNHSMSLNPEMGSGSNPEARSGKVKNNPIHEDMLEAAEFVKPSFLFNVIMDSKGNITRAVAGNYIKAHEEGCRIVDEIDGVSINEKADMVIATAGGYPKDINFYQTIKTVINAKEAVKKDGVMIILSECSDGFGNDPIREIIQNYSSLEDRERALRENYSIAKYIGYYVTEVAENHLFILVSKLAPKAVSMANINVVKTADEALKMAYKVKGKNLKTYLMPQGANTFPKLRE
ncbi:lactate racemase domain-containing protein [Maledivibacter halophilus]|uniref:Nickel-dependent lactate racemase n=1 Tax=Maledivibacter halophilus TaxID=36842 RepID=A0A1T5J2H1_9FIRM|nr:nickel-dependent lactate racemase [Maledivibacter halophilus]SKC45521.1 Nickel-dependent lactate racemase [Maledivibacter halophilus]